MVLKGAMAKGKKEKAVTEKVELEPETEVQLAQAVETAEVLETEVLETEVDQEAVARMVEEEETDLVLVDKSTTSRCRNY